MHSNKANVGDIVRSWDFKPMNDRGDSFIEGIVLSKTEFSYVIAVQNRVFAGLHEAIGVGETVETPFKTYFGEYPDRIQKLPARQFGAAA